MNKDWSIKRLEEIATLTSSKRIYKNEYVKDGIPFYRSKEIKELSNNKEISLELFIKKERYDEIKNKFGIPKEGDILLTAVGTIGEMYVVKENEEFYFKDGNIMWLKDFDSLDSYYLKYVLTLFIDKIKLLAQGSAYSALTIEKLKKYEILVPPKQKQKQIVDILDKAFESIEQAKANIEKNIENTKELFQSRLNEIFSQKADGWEEKELGEVAQLKGRIGWKGLTAKEYQEKGPLFISVHSLNYGDYIDFSDAFHISNDRYEESPEIMLQENDILICKDGAGIGKLGIVPKLPDKATINSSILLIRSLKYIETKYLYYALLSPFFQKIVQDRLQGSTTPHLYQRDIKTFPIYFPKIDEQKKIVLILDSLNEQTKQLEKHYKQKLKNLEELKKSILQKAFSGELLK